MLLLLLLLSPDTPTFEKFGGIPVISLELRHSLPCSVSSPRPSHYSLRYNCGTLTKIRRARGQKMSNNMYYNEKSTQQQRTSIEHSSTANDQVQNTYVL